MRFVQIADLHLDTAFKLLSDRADFGDSRRLDQRKIFSKMIDYIKENRIPYLFICGDLYEHKSIRESSIVYINNLFNEIPDTKIYIVPGNHDPKIKNSFYATFNWAKNVHIFGEKLEVIEEDEFDLYGYGFEDFYMKEVDLDNIMIKNPDKINILLTHGSVDGGQDEKREYNPLSSSKIKNLGFDYIALGHIHKKNIGENDNLFVYPGSMCAMGFDELGDHGIVDGEIFKENGKVNRKITFVPLDDKKFVEIRVDVSDCSTIEDIVESISKQDMNLNDFYKVYLVGNRNFDINLNKVRELLNIRNVIKIKDNTLISLDLNEIANSTSLKGIFVKKMLALNTDENVDKEEINSAIQYGLDVLDGK